MYVCVSIFILFYRKKIRVFDFMSCHVVETVLFYQTKFTQLGVRVGWSMLIVILDQVDCAYI